MVNSCCAKSCLRSLISGCRTAPSDLVFILDGSWSVDDINFEIVKRWLVNITMSFNIGQKFTQVGVVQYSDDPFLHIPLGKHFSSNDLIKAMESIEYMGGNTNTGKAIKFANDKLFALSERGPNGIAKIAVVLTDGKSQDEVLAAAEAARKKGIILFAIGVGSETEEAELRAIANKPSSTYVFSVEDYKAIAKIREVIRQKLCEGKPPCSSMSLGFHLSVATFSNSFVQYFLSQLNYSFMATSFLRGARQCCFTMSCTSGDRFMESPRLSCMHNLVPLASMHGLQFDLCPTTSRCSEFTKVAVNCPKV